MDVPDLLFVTLPDPGQQTPEQRAAALEYELATVRHQLRETTAHRDALLSECDTWQAIMACALADYDPEDGFSATGDELEAGQPLLVTVDVVDPGKTVGPGNIGRVTIKLDR